MHFHQNSLFVTPNSKGVYETPPPLVVVRSEAHPHRLGSPAAKCHLRASGRQSTHPLDSSPGEMNEATVLPIELERRPTETIVFELAKLPFVLHRTI